MQKMLQQLYTQSNYRYERKFFISTLTKQEVEAIVKHHPAMFSEIFYERFVNNIYFDSYDLKNYFANTAGAGERIKVRVRWYGNLFGPIEKPTLELKIKNNNLGCKISYPLSDFSFDRNFSIETIREVFRRSQIPAGLLQELLCLDMILLSRYKRKYFQSKDRGFRFTLDSNMTFYQLLPRWNNFLNSQTNYGHIVLELKYERKQEDSAGDITNFLPFRMTKSSKYVSGVEQLNPW